MPWISKFITQQFFFFSKLSNLKKKPFWIIIRDWNLYECSKTSKWTHEKKGKHKLTNVTSKKRRYFDLKSSHFKEGGFHVGTHELIFVLFTADSVCKLERIDNNYLSFILNNEKRKNTWKFVKKKSKNKFLLRSKRNC